MNISVFVLNRSPGNHDSYLEAGLNWCLINSLEKKRQSLTILLYKYLHHINETREGGLMRKYFYLAVALLFPVCLQAIGLQHGLFRSQSTQGEPWQGTATITQEHYNITVHADYLDVELEWVFEANGATKPDSFTNALEIVGNLNLVDKSTVVGMITWYKGEILKGKLKTNDVAREQYEDVVQRDSDIPPPPRDPVLLEWIRDDNYDISIFPVEFGGTRKVRIRYLIPAFSDDGVNKIDYPHAFTGNATVSIKKGSDIAGYKIETTEIGPIFTNREFVPLSSVDYSFEAYSSRSSVPRISKVIPVLNGKAEGSRMYTSDFSTEAFSGQMMHVTTMNGHDALKQVSALVDFVILWRWNHTELLERYAREIVAQSKLLTTFLEQLDETNQRVALVIDKEGGERVTFEMSKKDGAGYKRMMAYLEELSAKTVVDPPYGSSSSQYSIDVQKSREEFEAALAAAVSMFDQTSAAMRHLLILTSGPRLSYQYNSIPEVTWDSTINVSHLSSVIKQDDNSGRYGSKSYWPGVNLDGFIRQAGTNLTVKATVGNGTQSHTIDVLGGTTDQSSSYYYYSCVSSGTTDMHLFSSSSITEEITWSVYWGEELLGKFTEKPRVIQMPDHLQYARLIGSSVHLVPLAETMPSSMASTLGFIDEKYSLVALEEDALPADIAAPYETAGVPTLQSSEIFPATDEHADMPIKDWLAANPPEPMSGNDCYYYVIRALAFEDVMTTSAPPPAPKTNQAARVATPQAETITDEQAEPDFAAPITHEISVSDKLQTAGLRATVRSGNLSFVLPSNMRSGAIKVVLYDLTGRVIGRWTITQKHLSGIVSLPLGQSLLSSGTYLVRIEGVSSSATTLLTIQ